jgi:hypothetical protein
MPLSGLSEQKEFAALRAYPFWNEALFAAMRQHVGYWAMNGLVADTAETTFITRRDIDAVVVATARSGTRFNPTGFCFMRTSRFL